MIKNQQNKKCGLLGKTLGHSFSPLIHKQLADYDYSLIEIPEDSLEAFIKSDKYHSVNVTIPYKIKVIPYLDEISEAAREIGAVNVVTHTKDGRLFGDNTDIYGFIYMLSEGKINVSGKNVLILGSGGSSKTASVACKRLGASKIHIVSRTGETNYENVYEKHPDTQIIVNTTPVGMYPNNGSSPIDISAFPRLCGVADIVYNPKRTKLLMDAEGLGINHSGGLSMLVAQAKKACEIFTGEEICDSEINKITRLIENDTQNIVLVGMPGCGKTTVGKILSDITAKRLVDTDEMVEEASGMSIPEIFDKYGEDKFRELETQAIKNAGKRSGVIISTGGGAVTRNENYEPLHQNGKIIFIVRDTDKLCRDGRPLSLSGNLREMYQKRLPMYENFCDMKIENTAPEEAAKNIIKSLSEV